MGVEALPPAPQTERLRLRRLTLDDAAFIRELVNDPDWIRFIGDRHVHSDDDARAYLERGYLALYRQHGFGLWAVEPRESRTPLGICGLLKRDTLTDVDLGFAFLPAARGRGYASEAAAASLRQAHDVLGFARVVAICTPENTASRRTLEGIGMRLEKLFRMKDDAEELCLYASGADAQPEAAPE